LFPLKYLVLLCGEFRTSEYSKNGGGSRRGIFITVKRQIGKSDLNVPNLLRSVGKHYFWK
jgi:hypothetical protein